MLPSMSKGQRKSEENKQLRIIEVKLFAPTATRYPRFDYEEMRKELGGREGVEHNASYEKDAEELVRRLEKGAQTVVVTMPNASKKPGTKRKRPIKFAPEDMMDKGLGYDLEDEFIDDEQAYDEWVPTTMDTAKRGHYVNKGPLEFRQLDLDGTSLEEESNITVGETSLSGADGDEEGPIEAEMNNATEREEGEKADAEEEKKKVQTSRDI